MIEYEAVHSNSLSSNIGMSKCNFAIIARPSILSKAYQYS